MVREVMAIDTLHLMARQTGEGLSTGAVRQIGSDLLSVTVPVFHPGYGLAQGVGGSVTDFNSGTEMLPVNAAKIPAAGEHRKSSLCLRIGGVVLEVEQHTQLNRLKLLAQMALFAGETGGNQTVACN